MMKLKCICYVDCELWLRCNDIRLGMKSLCALLWYDDVNVLISHMRVVLKGSSHSIPIEMITMTIQGFILVWPKLSYDCERKTFQKGLKLSTEWTSSEDCPFPSRDGRSLLHWWDRDYNAKGIKRVSNISPKSWTMFSP